MLIANNSGSFGLCFFFAHMFEEIEIESKRLFFKVCAAYYETQSIAHSHEIHLSMYNEEISVQINHKPLHIYCSKKGQK